MAGVETAGKESVKADTILVRPCQGTAELQACVDLQKEVWNFSDAELIPILLN